MTLNFGEQELNDWIAKRQKTALPILPVPMVDLRNQPGRKLFCFSVALLRQQMHRIKYLFRCSNNEEKRASERLRMARPEVAKRRHERERRLRNDPTFMEDGRRRALKYYHLHRDAIVEKFRQRQSIPENSIKRREYMRRWWSKRIETDLHFRIRNRLKSRLWHAVSECRGKKAFRTMELIGCSVEDFRIRFERQFKPGMNWDRFKQGDIHIDHIKPCALFDFSKPEDQKSCFHFSNLQPLWDFENRSKSAKFVA